MPFEASSPEARETKGDREDAEAPRPSSSAIVEPEWQRRGNPGAPNAVEDALAEALRRASEAGAWDVVGQLARELEARRKARAAPEVVDLDAARRKRER